MPLRNWYDKYDENYFWDIVEQGVTIYTSGSSGEPKPIYNPATKIKYASDAAIEVQNITENSTIYTCLNPERAGGLFAQTIPGLIAGATVDLVKFSPYAYVKAAPNYTHTHLTPKQAKAVMLTKGFKTLDLTGKTFLVGSEPVTWDIIEAFAERGARVILIWGMSEIGVNAILHIFDTVDQVHELRAQAPTNATVLGNISYCDWRIDNNNCLWVNGNISVYDDWFNTKDLVVEQAGILYYTGRHGTPVDFNNPRKG